MIRCTILLKLQELCYSQRLPRKNICWPGKQASALKCDRHTNEWIDGQTDTQADNSWMYGKKDRDNGKAIPTRSDIDWMFVV